MMSNKEIGVIALGSNLPGGFRASRDLLQAAVADLAAGGFEVLQVSRWWRSRAWPDPSHPDYLNGVALVETALTPQQALATLLAIEMRFGRTRGPPNAPRTLDLDLIALGPAVVEEPGLTLPHPRAHLRRFVMGPLAEIASDWRHPGLGLTAAELAASADVGRDCEPEVDP
jgi:2-amino-4-hydroxy-6-hydroxymethyldihydropteridine diphosphokinase